MIVVNLLFVGAIVAAVIAFYARRLRRRRLRVVARTRPGATADLAIPIRSWEEMDDVLRARWCGCGGYLERSGEGTRETGGRRFRIARLTCQECERVDEVFFDTTDVLH